MAAPKRFCGDERHCVGGIARRRRGQRTGLAGESGRPGSPKHLHSITDVGAELFPWLPVRSLGSIKYDTRARLPRIKVPLLVMHSRADGLIGFHHAEKNYAAGNEPKVLWEIAGDHNQFLEGNRSRYLEGLNAFLIRVEKAQGQQPSEATTEDRR